MRNSRGHRGRRGAVAVEFALLLPFIMLVFSVGADWCRIYYCAHTIEDCARTGALAGSGIAYQERNLVDSARESRAKSEVLKSAVNLSPALDASDISVETAGNYVTVTVSYEFQAIVPFLTAHGAWTLSRSVRMPILP